MTFKAKTASEQKADEEAEALALLLYDNSSEISKVLPSKLLEPSIIISKILGYENVDAYAVDLIRQSIESYHLGGDDIEEHFKKYLGQFVDSDSHSDSEEEAEDGTKA